MATRHEITNKYAREYAAASNLRKGALLDELIAVTGWSRASARRQIRAAAQRRGPARAQVRKPRGCGYSYDALKVLIAVWTLVGEPCGKYLVVIVEDSLQMLTSHDELAEVADRRACRAQPRRTDPAQGQVGWVGCRAWGKRPQNWSR